MRVRLGVSWLGLAFVGACGGSTLGSGLDTDPEETGGASSSIPRAGAGGRSTGGQPPGAAGQEEPGAPSPEGGAPAGGGLPGGTPVGGGAPLGPPALAGFGGISPVSGGAPATAGFAAFGGMFSGPRSVPVPAPGPVSLEECTYSGDCSGGSVCTCRYACVGDSPAASCSQGFENVPAGMWSCELLATGRHESYAVGGVELARACQIVAGLAGGEPAYAGPETCMADQRERSEMICDYTDLCLRPLELGDGTTAMLGRTRYIGCSESGLCLIDDVAYRADDIDIEDRCEALLPYAEDPPEPVFADQPECATTITEDVLGACQTHTLCSETAEVGPSVSIENQEIVYVACESDGLGGSRCACASDDDALRFDVPWPSDDATACERARSACEGGFEFTGETQCRERSVSSGPTSCEVLADCSRPGSLAGADVTALGVVQASCEHDGDAYDCRCVSGGQGERIRVEQPSTFVGCMRAGEACRDAVEIRYVGDFGALGPPSP